MDEHRTRSSPHHSTWSVLYRLIEPGGNLHPIEILPLYGCALWWFCAVVTEVGPSPSLWCEALRDAFLVNLAQQLILFAIVVQAPTFVTGRMSYVDIGWPTGVCLLGRTAFLSASDLRGRLIGAAAMAHGGRMAVGALYLLFPYTFKNGDLPRYHYAREKFVRHTGRPALWRLKQQHETLMQCFANSVVLAGPLLISATNPRPGLTAVERAGVLCWALSWALESLADLQKAAFLEEAKRSGDITADVLGHGRYSGAKYGLWTLCRHPNYFFEFMCWTSFTISAIPSAMEWMQDDALGGGIVVRFGVFLVLFYTVRGVYDCLVYWTGAEPAEARSVERRPLYKDYQRCTNVLFPISLPFFDHHRSPGWPLVGKHTSLPKLE